MRYPTALHKALNCLCVGLFATLPARLHTTARSGRVAVLNQFRLPSTCWYVVRFILSTASVSSSLARTNISDGSNGESQALMSCTGHFARNCRMTSSLPKPDGIEASVLHQSILNAMRIVGKEMSSSHSNPQTTDDTCVKCGHKPAYIKCDCSAAYCNPSCRRADAGHHSTVCDSKNVVVPVQWGNGRG